MLMAGPSERRSGHNKFGFVLRQFERRLRVVEGPLGIEPSKNLVNAHRPEAAETIITETEKDEPQR
jgi:hypothetical protein